MRFERAHAQNVVTLPSHANILSGRLPLAHGVHDNSGFRFPEDVPTLATLLKQRGYRTGAFVSAFPLDSRFGLTRGFDAYDDRLADPEARRRAASCRSGAAPRPCGGRRWLDAQAGAQTFLWVHVYDPHFPYDPPEPFASRFAGDPTTARSPPSTKRCGRCSSRCSRPDAQSRTLVVLTSDHGEALEEHGEPTHGIFAYEGTLRVPLVFHQPGILEPRVVGDAVQHVDILPTVLDAAGRRASRGPSGLQPAPAAGGRRSTRGASATSRPSRACSIAAGRRCEA